MNGSMEKVIVDLTDAKDIVSAIADDNCMSRDNYRPLCSAENLIGDAIVFLKAREHQMVVVDDKPMNVSLFGFRCGYCPNCKQMLNKKYHEHYCGYCGQAVKWE